MNKYLVFLGGVLVVGLLGLLYWVALQDKEKAVIITPPVVIPVVVPAASSSASMRTYSDPVLGFAITLPTPLSNEASNTLYLVDPSYVYTAKGPLKSISGVKFTIPSDMATGTNLSRDTYISVEHLAPDQGCKADTFLANKATSSQVVQGGVTYSFATSSESGAGNRYEEYVYAVPNTNPCLAVRYFIHYSAIENYDTGSVKEFNKQALISTFDAIRKTLVIQSQKGGV